MLGVSAYHNVVDFVDQLLEGGAEDDDDEDLNLEFKSKLNLVDPSLNLDPFSEKIRGKAALESDD